MAKQLGSQLDLQKIPVLNIVIESSPTAPSSPVNGQLWFDTTAGMLKVREGGSWLQVSNTAGGSTPTGPASGDLSGTYPGPDIGAGKVTFSKMAADTKDQVAGTASMRTLGTGSTQAAAGDHTHTKAAIGLSNVPNVDTTNASNITTGTLPTSVLPPLAVNEVFTAANQAAMLALTAQRGDMAIRTDTSKTYVLSTDSPGTLADWKEVMATGQVTSVAGKTGVVALVKADVGLDQVDNTSDANKPVSTATTTALAGKANTSHTHAAGTDLTGQVPVANGGTGASTAAAARTNLGAVGKFAGLVGALNAGSETTVTHSLNSTDVIAGFKVVASNRDIILDWRTVDANTIGITADVAYAANAIRAVVVG
jgi:hypothetical protein